MTKANSYYDWELRFKKIKKTMRNECNIKDDQEKDLNQLGISDKNFKKYINKWKKRNLI